MDFGNLIWIFLIIVMLQPLLQRRVLMILRQRKISQLEKKRESRVILLVHRQETMSLLGFPLMRYIDVEDSEDVLRAIHMTDPDLPVDIVLHTPGGLVLAALQIARALKRHPGKVTVFVPHYAMSGGTLLALAADEIVMCHHSVLGPVDPQVEGLPAASLKKVAREKPIKDTDDKTLILADVGDKAVAQLRAAVEELLQETVEKDKAQELAEMLTSGLWTHDYAITDAEAKAMGLPITNEMPEEVFDLLQLYPQPVRRAGVEYLPIPHEKRQK